MLPILPVMNIALVGSRRTLSRSSSIDPNMFRYQVYIAWKVGIKDL